MAARGYQSNDLRRQVGSPKPKGRDHKDTLCRNILIYGHCRYENTGCTFNHDQNKGSANTTSSSNTNSTTSNHAASEMTKKAFNVESPSFTPSNISKKSTFSSQALSAAPFTPRNNTTASSTTTTPVQHNGDQAVFAANPASIPEFAPQNYGLSSTATTTPTGQDSALNYDPFGMSSVGQALPTTPYNPYADDHNAAAAAAAAAMGATNPGFFQQNFTTHAQPLMHHLYFPAGPHKEDLLLYQRAPHDFFISEKLRQDLQKKAEAALQVINTGLPQLDNFHSLVALDTTNRKNANIFGYPSWVYKAVDGKTGYIRCLRRLEGFRLSNENAIRSVKEWRRIDCGNIVSIFDAFTTRAFGDSSIVFVQEFFPLSKTLMEVHFPNQTGVVQVARYKQQTMIPENTIWAYITQIANALKAIHAANLAARCVDLSKIILTDKNRIRLGACSILDVVQFEARRPVLDLQQEDLLQFGRVILSLASLTPPTLLTNANAAMEHLGRHYSVELRDTVLWLLTPQQQQPKNIDEFVRGIATHFVMTFDQALHESDTLRSELATSLENGRIARLMMKLAVINERPEFNGDTEWSENGDRYTLKLFRDYVFHQVDSAGHPVVDLGHMISCMNKLDAGTDERVCLTSRDEQTVFVVTYRSLREQVRAVFAEVSRAAKGRGGL